jgi:hypothetical protein
MTNTTIELSENKQETRLSINSMPVKLESSIDEESMLNHMKLMSNALAIEEVEGGCGYLF